MQVIYDGFIVLPYCPLLESNPKKLDALLDGIRRNAFRICELTSVPYIIAFPSYRRPGLFTIEADLITVDRGNIRLDAGSIEDIRECFQRYGSPTATDDQRYSKYGYADYLQYIGYYSKCERIKEAHIIACCEAISDILYEALSVNRPKPSIADLERQDYGDINDE